MVSSDLVNSLFCSFARFVNKLTDREIKFEELRYGEALPGATLKINKFLKEATEAFDNPEIKTLGALEPGKLYCLQVDSSTANWKHLETLSKGLADQNIKLAVIDQGMNFISVPEGYEMVKKN